MTDTPLDRIIERTSKVMRWPEEIILLPKKKKERAAPPSWDLGERNWNKQIDEILKGKKKAEKAKWPDDKSETSVPVKEARP